MDPCTLLNERGEIISYSGRDLNFETKWDDWIKSGKPEGKKPGKHRYVSGYHRGLELYSGHATRLQEPWVKESLNRYGLVIVEGMNDVMRLDELQVAAVGLGSNKVTTEQLEKLTRFARQLTNNRIRLLPDCDEEGESGFKDLLWKLAENQLQTRLAWSSKTNAGRQPESLTQDEWQVLIGNSTN
jgi:5S rRNA maturation endonuclease (ribonuclease M5)